jgi:predicted lipid-binding transport protein (Tim44 family)
LLFVAENGISWLYIGLGIGGGIVCILLLLGFVLFLKRRKSTTSSSSSSHTTNASSSDRNATQMRSSEYAAAPDFASARDPSSNIYNDLSSIGGNGGDYTSLPQPSTRYASPSDAVHVTPDHYQRPL